MGNKKALQVLAAVTPEDVARFDGLLEDEHYRFQVRDNRRKLRALASAQAAATPLLPSKKRKSRLADIRGHWAGVEIRKSDSFGYFQRPIT